MRALVLVLALGACSVPDKFLVDGGGSGSEHDAPLAIDGRPLDGPAARYPCLGQPLPTSAPATITLSGTTVGVAGDGLLPNAQLTVLTASSTLFVTSSDTNGNYGLSLQTSSVPLNAYIHAQYTGRLDTYDYPPSPYAGDYHDAIVLVTAQELAQAASIAGTNYNTGNAQMFITVVDCDGMPVSGATVTTVPLGMVVPLHNGLPNTGATATDASGQVIVFNVAPAITITATATTPDGTFRSTVIHNPTNAVLMTRIQP